MLAVVLLILLGIWISPAHNPKVPGDLIGEWRTTNRYYSDRIFELDSVSINFGTGIGSVDTGFIDDVRAVSEGHETLYTINYTVDGVSNQVSFYYNDVKKVIEFKNQRGIEWRKQQELPIGTPFEGLIQ